jgi:integrase
MTISSDRVFRFAGGTTTHSAWNQREVTSNIQSMGTAAIQDCRMTVSSFVETKFIPEHVEHKRPAGQTHYKAILKHLLKPETVNRIFKSVSTVQPRLQALTDWPYLDNVRLCDFTTEHVRRLVSAAFDSQYSWQTVKHIKNVTFAIIAHAQREGCFNGSNPASQVKLPQRSGKATPDLSLDQMLAVLKLLKFPEKDVAIFMVSTGMNVQEICNVKWKDVNLSQSARLVDGELIPPHSIAVRQQWDRRSLGDSRQGRNRNIAIPAPLFSLLADRAQAKGTPQPEEFVLTSDGGVPISPGDIHTGKLAPARRKLGLPWLSWRVLSRAHQSLLSEFRPQLENLIATAGLGTPATQSSDSGAGSSGTIGPKISCRSSYAVSQLRQR